jgi:hypothetical protein
MPYHRPDQPPPDEFVPDWVLGGAGRRRILERLAESRGYTGTELKTEAGHAWVYEMLRALKAIDAVELVPNTTASYRLSKTQPVGKALIKLVAALRPLSGSQVSRPPSRRR